MRSVCVGSFELDFARTPVCIDERPELKIFPVMLRASSGGPILAKAIVANAPLKNKTAPTTKVLLGFRRSFTARTRKPDAAENKRQTQK